MDEVRARRQPALAALRSARRRLLRRTLLGAIAILYVISIPWYRETAAQPGVWWGLPDWVAVAVGSYAAVAVLNALAWLLTEVPDAEPTDEDAG